MDGWMDGCSLIKHALVHRKAWLNNKSWYSRICLWFYRLKQGMKVNQRSQPCRPDRDCSASSLCRAAAAQFVWVLLCGSWVFKSDPATGSGIKLQSNTQHKHTATYSTCMNAHMQTLINSESICASFLCFESPVCQSVCSSDPMPKIKAQQSQL